MTTERAPPIPDRESAPGRPRGGDEVDTDEKRPSTLLTNLKDRLLALFGFVLYAFGTPFPVGGSRFPGFRYGDLGYSLNRSFRAILPPNFFLSKPIWRLIMENRAQTLADNARGDSVTKKRLTKLESGFGSPDYLSDNPIIWYLNQDEQLHHILFNYSKGISINGKSVKPNGQFLSLLLITNERISFIFGNKSNDKGSYINYSDVNSVETSKGMTKSKITIDSEDANIEFYINSAIDFDEVETAKEYIMEQADAPGNTPQKHDTKLDDIPDIRESTEISDSKSSDISHSKSVSSVFEEVDERDIEFISKTSVKDARKVEAINKAQFLGLTTDALLIVRLALLRKHSGVRIPFKNIEWEEIDVWEEGDSVDDNTVKHYDGDPIVTTTIGPTTHIYIPFKKDGQSRSVTLSIKEMEDFLYELKDRSPENLKISQTNGELEIRTPSYDVESTESPLEILKRRFAQGEISKKEFEERKEVLNDN